MTYLGDFALGKTFDCKFCTVGTTGAPTTLAGSPAVSAYVDNNTTELTAGITLTVDFDGRTGLHNVRVVATGGNGYAAGGNYQLVITAGTVGGTSVVGYVIGQFSIEARSHLRPTVVDRTLDVTATGAAGIDLGNVENQGTTLALSATTIKAVTDDVGITQAGADKAWSTASRTLTAFGFSVNISAGAVQAIWDALSSALTTSGSIGKRLVDFITGDAFARLGAPVGASISADIAAVKTETAAIKAKTDNLPSDPADASDIATATTAIFNRIGAPVGASISADVAAVKSDTAAIKAKTDNLPSDPADESNILAAIAAIPAAPSPTVIADAFLDRDMAAGTDSGSPTFRTPRQALRFLRNHRASAAGTLTVKKEDDTTTSWTAALTTDAAAVPVITVDPAGP